ncbi:hypothetical protein HAZT_HAZT005678, partial [Hyalella azteca]
MQHDVIYEASPYGLPINLTLLPEWLGKLDYQTEAVGKWHLGLCNHSYLPSNRGFDHHYGYWAGHMDYYDHTVFMEHCPIKASSPYGLPLDMKILPQYMKDSGYITRAVGKWHLGFHHKEFTPTFRGFESHYGYWSNKIDYFNLTADEDGRMWGYDFRRDMNIDHDAYGIYATDLFTTEALSIISSHNTSRPLFLYLAHLAVHSANPYAPLQAPQAYVDRFSYIKDERRRKFAGMLTKLDESVGAVVTALRDRKMFDNTVIVFTSDNGGPAGGYNNNVASNWPLRGVRTDGGSWSGDGGSCS